MDTRIKPYFSNVFGFFTEKKSFITKFFTRGYTLDCIVSIGANYYICLYSSGVDIRYRLCKIVDYT